MIYKIVGYTMLCSSLFGNTTGKTGRAGFGTSKWTAYAVKQVFHAVEVVSEQAEKASKWIDDRSTELRNYSQEWIYAQDGYEHSEFKFSEQPVEEDWVLIDTK